MRRIMLLLLCVTRSCFAGSMQSAQDEGKSFGKEMNGQAIEKMGNHFRADDLMPKDAKPFQTEEAYKHVKSNQQPDSVEAKFLMSSEVQRNERENKNFHPDEHF